MPALRTVFARCRVVAPLLLLAACAHRPATPTRATTPQVAPQPTLVRYVTPVPPRDAAPLAMHGAIPPGTTYTVDVLANSSTCTGHQRVGVSSGSVDLADTALIAERWQTLEIFFADRPANRACTVRVSFAPRHGRSYQLRPQASTESCSAFVFDTTDPQAPQMESTFRARTEPDDDCVPLALASPAYGKPTPQVSVKVRDLPTAPDADALSAKKAPRQTSTPGTGAEVVTDDDLNGLTGH